MFLTQISEGGILSIYDKTKLMCRTWIESVNNLFNMGKDLETEVDGLKGGIVKDVNSPLDVRNTIFASTLLRPPKSPYLAVAPTIKSVSNLSSLLH